MSKTQKAKLAKKALKQTKGSIKNLKKKARWTLRGRTERFRKPKKLTKRQKEQKKKEIRKQQKKKANLQEAKFIARKILHKRSQVKSRGKKNLKKEARKLAKKVVSGNNSAVRIALGLNKKKVKKTKAEKKIIAEKKRIKRDNQKGKFCVQSVVWNLSHCCFFTRRIEAQTFANTLPTPEVFNRRLKEGRRALAEDKRRIANRKIGDSSKDFKKVMKIVAKRKKSKGKK